MNLIVITALIAVCGAAKLDRTYLPPSSAGSAGGSPGSLQAPGTRSSEQGLVTPNFPTGSYANDFGGVVVDAASPGTRTSEGQSGLGGSRPSYGSTNSKVGDAAFRGSVAGFRGTPSFGASGQTGNPGQNAYVQFDNHAGNGFASNGQSDTHADGFSSNGREVNSQIGSHTGQASNGQAGQFSSNGQSFDNKSERPQAAKDRNSNILALSNDVNSNSYSYGFETDNGITVGENGVAVNGIQAEGGYSYQGDDGQVYKITYTADEGGYRPQGAHLPTPPPIPDEILKSLEQNAKEEAAGLVDDGSYDAQKYNTDGDYTQDNAGSQYNGAQLSQFGKRPQSETFNNQNGQAYGKPGSTQFGADSNAQNSQQFGVASNANLASNGQSDQVNGNKGSGHFGATPNAQTSFNGQMNGKPGSGQFGITGPQPLFNGQSAQGNKQPGSAQLGSGLQSTHSSSLVNNFDSNSALNGNTGSQSSHTSQSLSGHHGSSATIPVSGHTGTQPSSSGQAQSSFGGQTQFGSQFNQHAESAQYGNQTPESSSQQNHQGFNTQLSAGNSQSTQPMFGSSFKPQGSEAFSGASLNQDQDKQDFGKPSPQTFIGQNFNRPSSAGNFNYNKQTFGQDQMKFGSAATNGFNRFPQASAQLGNQKEYLPPLNSNGQLQQGKPESSAPGFTSNYGSSELNSNGQKNEQKDQLPDFVALNRPKPGFASASASTSFGQSVFQPQPARPLNAFDTQTQTKPNQFNQQQSTQQTNQLSSQTPDQLNSNSQQSSSFAAQTISDFGSKPTTVPDTELTTPLEPNATPTSQGSQFPSQTTSSFSSFGSKPASNSQTQAQFISQGNSGLGQQSTGHTLSPTFPTSSPITNSQFGTTFTQSAFQSSLGTGPGNNSNGKPQFPQNSFSQTQQHQGIDNSYYYNQPSKAFGTPGVRPQGTRFPSSPSYQSNEVAAQNQQSFQSSMKFPGSLAPVGPTSTTQFAQSQGYNGITQAAISPFPVASPTPSSQFSSTQNGQFGTKPSFNQQSTFSNQAQLSAEKPTYNQQSAFGNQGHIIQNKPSFPPQPMTGRFPPISVGQENINQENKFPQQINDKLPSRPISQFGQKPTSSGSQTQNQFGQSEKTPESSNGSSQQQTLTQQYQGTIYQYNKPAEVLPASAQTDSSSSPTIQTVVTDDSKPSFGQSQGNQLSSQQNTKPFSQASDAGSKFDAQSKPFGSPQLGQYSQTTHGSSQQGIQFGSQPARPSNAPSSTNIQFSHTASSGDQSTKPFGTSTFGQSGQSSLKPGSSSLQQTTQGSQIVQSSKPFGLANQDFQSSFGSKPQLGSQTTQFSQTTQSFGSSSTQPEKVLESQYSSQTFQNTASSQENGYLYPKNPKPQFVENSKNQYSQNTQPGGSQSGSNQYQIARPGNSQTSGFFNQQSSQFNSASKPFEPQSQNNQNTAQATFGQKNPNSPIQPFSQPQFGQSTASSQAFASGPATTFASASSSDEYKPFSSQNKNQFSQTQKPDNQGQSEKGTQQVAAENIKRFGGNTQDNEAPNAKPFGASQGSIEASKPLFNSACCQSKDSTPAQSTDRPSSTSFQGTQSFSAQSFSGKGEQFGGPRAPPTFDEQTGYHY